MTKDASQIRVGDLVQYAPPGHAPNFRRVKSVNSRSSTIPGRTSVDIRVESMNEDEPCLMVAVLPCEIEVAQ